MPLESKHTGKNEIHLDVLRQELSTVTRNTCIDIVLSVEQSPRSKELSRKMWARGNDHAVPKNRDFGNLGRT